MYRTFIRTWYILNGDKKVPGPGVRQSIRYHDTEDEARTRCRDYNASHDPGPLSVKCEYEAGDRPQPPTVAVCVNSLVINTRLTHV